MFMRLKLFLRMVFYAEDIYEKQKCAFINLNEYSELEKS